MFFLKLLDWWWGSFGSYYFCLQQNDTLSNPKSTWESTFFFSPVAANKWNLRTFSKAFFLWSQPTSMTVAGGKTCLFFEAFSRLSKEGLAKTWAGGSVATSDPGQGRQANLLWLMVIYKQLQGGRNTFLLFPWFGDVFNFWISGGNFRNFGEQLLAYVFGNANSLVMVIFSTNPGGIATPKIRVFSLTVAQV